jgi:hypothetical protein
MRTAHGLPLSALESMTLSYVPLFAVTYAFWWVKPKDVQYPTVVELPAMTVEQRSTFERLAVSDIFDDENGTDSLASVWALTPRVFEK